MTKLDIKGEENVVAWTGGVILGIDGTLTSATYVAWDPHKEFKEQITDPDDASKSKEVTKHGTYVFVNPTPFLRGNAYLRSDHP